MMSSNPTKSKRPSRRPSSRKARPRLFVLDVEALEARFLLSTASEVLLSGTSIVSTVAPPSVAVTPDPAGTLVDAYTLPAGSGYPAIRVELAWFPGQDPAVGSLRVLDDFGTLLHQVPLEGVSSLHALLDVASGSTSKTLEVDLSIQSEDASMGSGGSYRLDVSWLLSTSATTHAVIPPITGSIPSSVLGLGVNSPASLSSQTIPPPLPSLHAGGFLPAFPVAGIPSLAGQSPPGTLQASPPPGSVTPPLPLAGGFSGVEPYTPPGRATPLPNPSAPVGSASTGTSTIGDQGRATFLGPLPLGPSTADGGLFARQSIPVEAFPIQETSGFETSVVIQGAAAAGVSVGLGRTTAPAPRRRSGSIRPSGPRWPRQPSLGFSQDEASDRQTTEGTAFLPTIVAMAPARIEARPTVDAKDRRPARSKEGVIASALLVMTGSVLMILGLNAPERRATLSAWREARRARKSA